MMQHAAKLMIIGGLWIWSPIQAEETPYTFGIFPYLSSQKLIAALTPLRDHLQAEGAHAINVATAPDYADFLQRMRNAEYDLIFVPPHFAWIAEHEVKYRRLAMTRYQIHAYIVVDKDTPLRSMADLKGKKLAIPPRQSMNYLLMLDLLTRNKLQPGRDVQLQEYDTNENALAAPLRGDADAGLTGHLVWMKSSVKERLRALAQTESVPGFMVLVNPRVASSIVAKWRAAILGFSATPQGRAHLDATGYEDWLALDEATMRSIQKYMPPTPKE
ncbi:MAG: phosphate/phosphite/phosphonate ABC transporter substrate-binding protein [Gammaproteobacteria bacterium]|nr:phosphate/phosphite/phosphonate ABC transporter substrate-binding protein [Gammaproteobacteria bacterium]